MKKNMHDAMERLGIDENIKPLMRQLWKHCYRTKFSCEGESFEMSTYEGHGSYKAYVVFKEGDGWFEKNASKYGLEKVINKPCCDWFLSADEKTLKSYMGDDYQSNNCGYCGAGLNGNIVYEGELISNPFKPDNID